MGLYKSLCIFVTILVSSCRGLENGLARTPPMGFMTWQRYRCNIDCKNYPQECISENLIKSVADIMVSQGYLAVGYEYLIIDDCWLSHERAADGQLQPDPVRFPNGIKKLADYVHGLGLKFGIYQDYGTLTCAGYPGMLGHLEQDANTFAEWGVDYVKVDGCNSEIEDQPKGYVKFGEYLNKTGRPMVYSCSYPAYQNDKSKIDFKLLTKTCNLWRTTWDIDDSLTSMNSITDWCFKYQDLLTQYGGPGHWNDPDQLLIGGFGLSLVQSEAQMAIWAILAAPLLMSADLSNIRDEYKNILLNKDVIAVNQDPLGIQGTLVSTNGSVQIWVKPLQSKFEGKYAYAVAFVSRRSDGEPFATSHSLSNLGTYTFNGEYQVENLYKPQEKLDFVKANGSINVRVAPSGVVFLKLTPVQNSYLV